MHSDHAGSSKIGQDSPHPSLPNRPRGERRRKRGSGQPAGNVQQGKVEAGTTVDGTAEELPEAWYSPWVSEGTTDLQEETLDCRLHRELVAYVTYIMPTAQEEAARQALASGVRDVIRARWHKATVSIFGSVTYNLCLPKSDVDLVVTLDDNLDVNEKKERLFEIRRRLRGVDVLESGLVVPSKKVPVLTFVCAPRFGSIGVDISINEVDGIGSIAPVNAFLDTMPALRPLVLVLKALLDRRGLATASTGGLSSFSVICMVVSFLQLNPTSLPLTSIEDPLGSQSLGTLFQHFLAYYGCVSSSESSVTSPDSLPGFPYDTHGISITERRLVLKADMGWSEKNKPWMLSIQSLHDPGMFKDIARGTSRIREVTEAFAQAYNLLLQPSAEQASILEPLVGLSQLTLDRRTHMARLHDSGELQRAWAAISSRRHHPRVDFRGEGNYGSRRARPHEVEQRGAWDGRKRRDQSPPRRSDYVDRRPYLGESDHPRSRGHDHSYRPRGHTTSHTTPGSLLSRIS